MFGMDDSKLQGKDIPTSQGLPEDIIVSRDTLRANRIPPGQSRTPKWPVLDAYGAPKIDMAAWTLQIHGLVNQPHDFSWEEFQQLPRVRVFSDFHCVTRWSRLGNVWTGVSTRHLVELCGGTKPEARFVVLHAYDFGWTTNLPLADFLSEDALIATEHDGEPISLEHGGPARAIVPLLYAWKSAKWIGGIEFVDRDKPGFWERNGYHNHGDPWKEQRYNYS